MGAKKTEKQIKSLLSSTIHTRGVVSLSLSTLASLSILPFILAKQLDAYYIDAGTTGMIIQGLIGVLVTGLAMAAVFRRRLIDWVKGKLKRYGDSGDEEDSEGPLSTETKGDLGE